MNLILNEKQFKLYKNFLLENIKTEGRDITSLKKYKEKVQPLINDLENELFGDEKGTENISQNKHYQLNKYPITNDLQLASGLFSIGNAKLSDDTLIINFTSALKCPSVQVCPVTQNACYAAAGEIRLPLVRRKNMMIQNMWARAIKSKLIGKVFGIAQMYIEILKDTKKPIKYIRFNEAGDFINDAVLDAAALFASEMKNKYGVISMAYTANNNLDFTKKINGVPIDKIIKINASRLDIKLSNDSTHNSFIATSMDFSKILSKNNKVVSISDAELKENKFECLGVLNDPQTNAPSIPVLTKGKWSGGEGWYYVCPCSFWRFNKDKKTLLELKKMGIIDKTIEYLPTKELANIIKKLTEEQKNIIKSETNKIKSPCGTKCAVCFNMSGGVSEKDAKYSPEQWKMIRNYTVLESTHGATSGNYKVDYANAKRQGNDNVTYTKNNPYGRITKYDKNIKKQ